MTVTLAEAIKMVLPHASKDSTLPAITMVLIRPHAVMATDRYTMAIVALETGAPEEGIAVPGLLAKQGIEKIHEGATGWAATLSSGAVMELPHRPGEVDYPEIERIAAGFEPATSGAFTRIGLDPKFAAKFDAKHFPGGVKANRPHYMVLEFDARGAHKPVRVTFSGYPDYTALWVPVKLEELEKGGKS